MSKQKRLSSTVLCVEIYAGLKVFRLGTLRIDQLNPYDMLAQRPDTTRENDTTSIEVFRGDTLFDTGTIVEFGTHAASHCLMGLQDACPSAPRVGESIVIIGNLSAEWFEAGDELHLSCSARDVRYRIIDNWHEQLLKQPRYAEWRRTCSSELSARMIVLNRKRQQGLLTDRQYYCKSNLAWKQCFHELNKAIGMIPIPEIICWQRIH